MADTNQMQELLELSTHYDKDKRFMALRDLTKVLLEAGLSSDNLLWPKILDAYLHQLEDKSTEVQANAIKCIGDVLIRFPPMRASKIMSQLVHGLTTNQNLREIYSICIRSLLSQPNVDQGRLYCSSVFERLVLTLERLDTKAADASEEASIYCDVLSQIIERFYGEEPWPLERLLNVLFLLLDDRQLTITCRRKASTCLGIVAPRLDHDVLLLLADRVLERSALLYNEASAAQTESTSLSLTNELPIDLVPFFSCAAEIVGCMNQSNAIKLAPFVPTLLSAIRYGTKLPEGETEVSMVNCGVVEAALHVLTKMCEKTPNALQGVADDICKVAVDLLSFDPGRYDFDVGSSDQSPMMDIEAFELDEEFGVDDFLDVASGDVDDLSWKVRKASIKLIRAIATSEEMGLSSNGECCSVESLWSPIIHRLCEPEPAVRECVYQALTKFTSLLLPEYDIMNPLPMDPSVNALISESVPKICCHVTNEFTIACNPKVGYTYQKCHEAGLILIHELALNLPSAAVKETPLMANKIKEAFENSRYPVVATVVLCNIIDELATREPRGTAQLHLKCNDLGWIPILSKLALVESQAPKVVTQCFKALKSLLEALSANTTSSLLPSQITATEDLLLLLTERLSKRNPFAEAEYRAMLCLITAIKWSLITATWRPSVEHAVEGFLKRFVSEVPNRVTLEALKELQLILKTSSPSLMKSITIFKHPDEDLFSSLITHLVRHAGILHDNRSIPLFCLIILKEFVLNIELLVEGAEKELKQYFVTEELVLHVGQSNDMKLITAILQLISACLSMNSAKYKQIGNKVYDTVLQQALLYGANNDEISHSIEEFYEVLSSKQTLIETKHLLKDLDTVWDAQEYALAVPTSLKYATALLSLLSRCRAIVLLHGSDKELTTKSLQDIFERLLSSSPSLRPILVCGSVGARQPLDNKVFERLFQLLSSTTPTISNAASTAIGQACCNDPSRLISKLTVLETYSENNGSSVLNALSIVLDSINSIPSPVAQNVFNFLQFCSTKDFTDASLLSAPLAKLSVIAGTSVQTLLSIALQDAHKNLNRRFAIIIVNSLDLSACADRLTQELFNTVYKSVIALLAIDDLEINRAIYAFFTKVLLSSPCLLSEHDLSQLFNCHLERDLKVRQNLIREVDLGPFKRKTDDGVLLRLRAFEFLSAAAGRLRESELADARREGLIHTKTARMARKEGRQQRQVIAERLRTLFAIGLNDTADVQTLCNGCLRLLQ